MKKNIITIDLELLQYGHNLEDLQNAQVPTPCTLTDAVEKYGRVEVHNLKPECSDFNLYEIRSKEESEYFKENYLYKQDTLEDGIYEVEFGTTTQVVYVVNNRYSSIKNSPNTGDIKELPNPRKIADL